MICSSLYIPIYALPDERMAYWLECQAVIVESRDSNLKVGSGICILTGCRIPVELAVNDYLSQIQNSNCLTRKVTLRYWVWGLPNTWAVIQQDSSPSRIVWNPGFKELVTWSIRMPLNRQKPGYKWKVADIWLSWNHIYGSLLLVGTGYKVVQFPHDFRRSLHPSSMQIWICASTKPPSIL